MGEEQVSQDLLQPAEDDGEEYLDCMEEDEEVQEGERGSQGSDDYVDPFSEVEDWELRWAVGQERGEGQERDGEGAERRSPTGAEPRGDAPG